MALKPLGHGLTMNTFSVMIYLFIGLNLVQIFECCVVSFRSIFFNSYVESTHGLGSEFKP